MRPSHPVAHPLRPEAFPSCSSSPRLFSSLLCDLCVLPSACPEQFFLRRVNSVLPSILSCTSPRHGVTHFLPVARPFRGVAIPHHPAHSQDCHPDPAKRDPTFSFAPYSGASGRAVEGSWHPHLILPDSRFRLSLLHSSRSTPAKHANSIPKAVIPTGATASHAVAQWRDRGTLT